jgi:predicted DCC family thiol-disulfide oxidoreductase YuxK
VTGAVPGGAGTRRDEWVLVYDGECAFCRRCIALLARWDSRRHIRAVPFQDAAALAVLPPIPHRALEQAMHLVSPGDGIRAGAEAAPAILRLLPGGRPLATLFGIPGVPVLAARIYAAVARNRHRLGCGSAACRRGR